jgi:integrase
LSRAVGCESKNGLNIAPATVNRELAVMKGLYNKAMAWGKAASNPVHDVVFAKENNARVRWLTHNEAEQLEAACPPYLRSIVTVALHDACQCACTMPRATNTFSPWS